MIFEAKKIQLPLASFQIQLTILQRIHIMKRDMSLTPEDQQFLQGAGEKVADPLRDIKDRLEELKAYQYGRSIEFEETNRKELMGYILPLYEDQLSHLVIFSDNSMFVTTARQPGVDTYKANFAPNEEPLVRGIPRLSFIKESTITNSALANVLWRRDNPNHTIQINEAIDQAFVLAKKMKDQREQSMRATAIRFLDKVNEFLGYKPNDEQGEQSQPSSHEPPQQPQ